MLTLGIVQPVMVAMHYPLYLFYIVGAFLFCADYIFYLRFNSSIAFSSVFPLYAIQIT